MRNRRFEIVVVTDQMLASDWDSCRTRSAEIGVGQIDRMTSVPQWYLKEDSGRCDRIDCTVGQPEDLVALRLVPLAAAQTKVQVQALWLE